MKATKDEIAAAEKRGMQRAAETANAAYERWRKVDRHAAMSARFVRDEILEAAARDGNGEQL